MLALLALRATRPRPVVTPEARALAMQCMRRYHEWTAMGYWACAHVYLERYMGLMSGRIVP